MRKSWKIRMALVLPLTVAGAVLFSGFDRADARPQYRTNFLKVYTKVKDENPSDALTCLVCHEAKDDGQSYDTKKHNNYGTALKDVIEKNERDAKKMEEAFKKVEPKDSAIKGKTFGDLLKEGKLPASKE